MDRRKLLDKQKQKAPTLKVYYVPFGLRTHRHHHNSKKRDKNYIHHGYNKEHSEPRAMMSGDSPNTQKHELFDLKENRRPPSPTTSKDAAVQIQNANVNKTDLAAASVICEKIDDVSKRPRIEELPEAKKNEDEILATTEESPLRTEKKQQNDGNFISRNENLNRLDGISIKPVNKKEEDEEDESCGIKCLYYTLQCCECTII